LHQCAIVWEDRFVIMQARCLKRNHIELTVDDRRSSLPFPWQMVSIDEFEGEVDAIVPKKSDRIDRAELERPGVLVGSVCTLKKLWNLDEQSRFRELRKRIPLLAPFLDERLARLNSSVEGDIIQLLAIERPHLCVLPWLAAQPVPVSARR